MPHTTAPRVTDQAVREAMQANPDGFYIDHVFPSALSEGFPMYHNAPVVGQWLESIGFQVERTVDRATSGFAQTVDGICVYRGGFVMSLV